MKPDARPRIGARNKAAVRKQGGFFLFPILVWNSMRPEIQRCVENADENQGENNRRDDARPISLTRLSGFFLNPLPGRVSFGTVQVTRLHH
ncbi:hypothetical protein QWJ34_08485 [Saccharibacillus sp. CPCC 101409]|uniref:hypothetical protein n=1 Tax=Saccharibacillus sp. CPCC 101409 TaxID=3058041 RepID=UPI002672A247|nr:hypothetical protein [Saccharibacillus sp. CPCC 101409]MDO3409798.1 hypothetical protein [Saccharibacillus sp. CPCC 101409]